MKTFTQTSRTATSTYVILEVNFDAIVRLILSLNEVCDTLCSAVL